VKKEPIIELELASVLKGLDMNMEEFIDFCILCGSDYTKSIDGLGPSTAYKMIKEFKNIEGVLEEIKDINNQRAKDNKAPKYELPDVARYNYKAARHEFKGARVVDSTDLVVIVLAEVDRVWRPERRGTAGVSVHGEAVR
jgi:5'-3' exonuclease